MFCTVSMGDPVGVWSRQSRIRPRTKRVVVEYAGDVPVSTGMLPPESTVGCYSDVLVDPLAYFTTPS